MDQDQLELLVYKIDELNNAEALSVLAAEFPGGCVFSTSLSYEDQVITHFILSNGLPIELFTLDTGRLFAETYSVWSSTNERYNTKLKAYYPNEQLLQQFVEQEGPNAFYQSTENRKRCCYIRKVEPLKRALAGKKLWVTGLRAEHSASRHALPQLEWDAANNILKYHPLLHWSFEEVKSYIAAHNIPYNPLHDQGFVSIGCQPCTRAVKPGEDFRSGRWWWEQADKKECGLHAGN